jgi:lipopolysaccharide/colanic/teichoic acid biosynthesis glycosyltransferase
MPSVAKEQSQRVAPASAGRGSPRIVVAHRPVADDAAVSYAGVTQQDYVAGMWATLGVELMPIAWDEDDIDVEPGTIVAFTEQETMLFRAPEQMLRRLSLGECDAVILYGQTAPHYSESLELDEQGGVKGVTRSYTSGAYRHKKEAESAVPLSRISAIMGRADVIAPFLRGIGALEQAPPRLGAAGLNVVEDSVQLRDISVSSAASLRRRLLDLLGRDETSLALIAERAGLRHTSFGWAHPTAQMHEGVRKLGRVVLGPDVDVQSGAVLIGPLVLDRGERVLDQDVRRAEDELGADEAEAPILATEEPLDDTTPRQHARDHDPWFNYGYPLLKRLMDYAGAIVMLMLLAVVAPGVWIANRIHGDRGPLFYTHLRQTRGGKPFPCLKFRSMVTNADELRERLMAENELDGPQFKIENDPRITPVGNFLRKTNLDELPQAFNVLAGHMSLVGPRPSPHDENQLCPAWRHARLSVRPGITGLWQVYRSRDRGDDDFQEWIYYDMEYVGRRGLRVDCKILIKTVLVCAGLWTPKEYRRPNADPGMQ